MGSRDTGMLLRGEDLDRHEKEKRDRPRRQWHRHTAVTSSDTSKIDQLWREIRPGDRVRVDLPGGEQLTGTVDTFTQSLDAVWLLQDVLGRRMLHPADGLAVSRLDEEA